MAEMKGLTKAVSNYITLYPYKEVDIDQWPVYQNEEGEWVKYDEGWRDIGFKCPYPTVARLTQVRDLMSDMTVEDRSFKIHGGDPKRAAKFFVYNLIQDVIGLTNEGERVLYDKDTKEWLYNQFCNSSFLLSNFRSSYEIIAGKTVEKAKEEEGDFLPKSENTSDSSTKESSLTEDNPA
jgi:hypothetical protein